MKSIVIKIGANPPKVVEETASQCRRCKRHQFDPGVGKIAWRRKWQTHSSILAWKFHGQRSLAVYSPWSQSQTRLSAHTHSKFILYVLSSEHLYQFFREKNQFFDLKTPLLSRMYYFAIYTNIKSLHCTPETNIMLSVNYSSVKKKRNIFSQYLVFYKYQILFSRFCDISTMIHIIYYDDVLS